MQRLRRTSGSSTIGHLAVAQLKRKALSSWSAVQDTFFSTKDIYERHRAVFTISTSLASIATAWAGYTLRHLHESKVEQRLNSIEQAVSIYGILYTQNIYAYANADSPESNTKICQEYVFTQNLSWVEIDKKTEQCGYVFRV
ncbi:hypothetical protein U1Q18_001166 [Sarracenia purpurea var. burkii]